MVRHKNCNDTWTVTIDKMPKMYILSLYRQLNNIKFAILSKDRGLVIARRKLYSTTKRLPMRPLEKLHPVFYFSM